ncbi:D-isomer specific 2-hydroxyacid dehydrogenase, catalytic domain [Popillia japonica]|uniref:D-isomer specific 2-hydroxyacid dehydrogenase, catalytic domain n=1 Tax=Popillia japonica TaxID=7064 RepID=A0AAW1KIR3_POPJA
MSLHTKCGTTLLFRISEYRGTSLISAKMTELKVLITNPEVPKVAIDLLGAKCTLIINEETPYPNRQQILAKCPGVDAIFWATKERLDAEVLDTAGPQMKVVGCMSAGLDNVDVETLKARGIKLSNTPVVLNDAVADVAVLLTLGAARRITEGRRAIEQGTWRYGVQWQLGRDIAGSTVGIVGLGGIGQAIVTKLSKFGVSQFLYSGHKEKEEGKLLNAKFVTFDDLIKESDFVIIACPFAR